MKSKLTALIEKGICIPNPQSVEVGDDIDINRISHRGVTLHTGSKLHGKDTFVAEGVSIGFEAPTTVRNCYVGPNVALKGGFFEGAVFLKGAACGSGAHVRGGTILEEHASIAHTVGLKQTILLPYVTLGSLINFCDCLMAGGTGRKNHSEVGSSYIHFNFTPNQDKAAPSLLGDVPRGVMLKQPPIFLGGQGGLVGPCRLAYGTILAAGSLCRNDQLTPSRLVFEGKARKGSIPFSAGTYRNVKRLLVNNLIYIGNLIALGQWYRHVRTHFIGDELPEPLYHGLRTTLDSAIGERIVQMGHLAGKMNHPAGENSLQKLFVEKWPVIETALKGLAGHEGSSEKRNRFLAELDRVAQKDNRTYLEAIHSLTPSQASLGSDWLDDIVHHVLEKISELLPNLTNLK